jgi:hypothetical protein
MSYNTRRGILTAVAFAMTLGAAQFASGEGLTVGFGTAGATDEVAVNRATKTDRAVVPAAPVPLTRTIVIHVDRLPSTSVLVRVPHARQARDRVAPRFLQLRSGERKLTVACEPVVSVLTEIANRLQPGRCLS